MPVLGSVSYVEKVFNVNQPIDQFINPRRIYWSEYWAHTSSFKNESRSQKKSKQAKLKPLKKQVSK